MPCDSSHMAPHEAEKQMQRLAQLDTYIDKKLHKKTPEMVLSIGRDIYGKGNGKLNTDQLTARVCGKIRKMDTKQKERIVYNAKDQDSRDLATWWEAHEKADKEKADREKKQKKTGRLRESGLKKLSPAEKCALKV